MLKNAPKSFPILLRLVGGTATIVTRWRSQPLLNINKTRAKPIFSHVDCFLKLGPIYLDIKIYLMTVIFNDVQLNF